MSRPTDPILGPLNDPQRTATLHRKGPLLVLAGAGSGKTRALTHRIAHLIQEGVPPWQILAVTFTNKAASEMKERIKNLLHVMENDDGSRDAAFAQRSSKLPTMGTFHAICVRILRRDIEHLGREKTFVIYDDDDQERLMKQVLRDLHIDDSQLKARPALAAIGRFKAEALTSGEAMAQATTDRMRRVAEAFARYQSELRSANALDFDDLILETVRLFHECPDVLERYQETWRYLHVDEYQDTNHAQYLFITLLAQKYRNLCVIGDPDQSIYGFRGADIRNILQFEKEYPDATRIALEQNYRSVQPILTGADAVIAANPNRPEKTMWTERTEGEPIAIHEVADERTEAEEALRSVERLRSEGIPLGEQVILYRTHAQSRVIEEACMRRSIPYRILGGVKFYGRREIKDVLAYLYVLLNPEDTVSLLRIVNVPSRKLGDTTLGKLQAFAAERQLSLWGSLMSAGECAALDPPVQKRIASFVELIGRLRELIAVAPVSDVVSAVVEQTGLERWLRDGTEEGEERWQNVLELQSVTVKYDRLEPFTSLVSFLEEVALVSEVDKLGDGRGDALTLMTVHLCKGLEFEHVLVVGCEEGIFPHASSLFDRAQLEEERRLLYVAMTRAKSRLKLLFTRSRLLWGERRSNSPSRFLEDVPDAVAERRSDDVLSAFAWASKKAEEKLKAGGERWPAGRSLGEGWDDTDQSVGVADDIVQIDVEQGARIRHPSFGEGTVLSRRGDVVDIRFDSGTKKTFALSIAPLQII
ncbi:MAG: DNA helicase II / ATP-dependent DNA helicase PcrA [Candidatus Peregrinibacteria bacterium Gr01-1014_25]|nr:MAG: DNA helicase II / ATP-dependent DNA helicase PcrA [Candidatus Peregrinibacteria bacterium Gr01-1014_25]